MERGQHQMPRDGRPEANLGSFRIPHFAHQNHIGVLSQGSPQYPREIQFDLLVDLHLGDSRQSVLHRILDGDDLQLGHVDLAQCSVKRRRFSGACGARDQHHAGAASHHFPEALQYGVGHADAVQAAHAATLIEQPHDSRLAIGGGQGRQPHVDGVLFQSHAETAVLGQPFF